MEYKVKSPKLQDIETKTVNVYASASELGELDSGNLEIDATDIQADLVTADVIRAYNLTIGEVLTPTIASDVLTLDGSSAITASNKIHLVIRLK